jgi:hypothetical protein
VSLNFLYLKKPRSLRLKTPRFDKWRNYDLKFTTDTKVRKRRWATVIRDEGNLVEIVRKRCKKVVSLKEFNQNTYCINGKLEKPLTLNDDLFIPKQPRRISQRKKANSSAGNLLTNNKRRLKEVASFDRGSITDLSRKGPTMEGTCGLRINTVLLLSKEEDAFMRFFLEI